MKKYGCISAFIEEAFLQPFLSYGYDYELFWTLTPKTIKPFFKAHEMKVKEQVQLAWIQGTYVKRAIESSIFMCGLADSKTQKKLPKYPEQAPFTEEKDNTSQKTKSEYYKAIMDKWVKINNRK
jgi:hypothetical protein